MSDRPKNSPINIPIKFVEDRSSTEPSETEPYDDAIEIDGDALDLATEDDAPEIETMPDEAAAETPAAEDSETLDAEAVEDDERDTDTAAIVDADEVDADVEPEAESRQLEEVAESAQPEAFDFDETTPAPTPVAADAARPELSIDAFARLTQELRQKTEQTERLSAEKSDLFDRLLRKQAEFENFRKRTEREMQEAYRRARADILLDILPSLDNLERALKHSENADATVLHEGLALIYKQLSDTLGRHGLEAIESIGTPFDPEFHEAVAAEPNDEVEDHTVLDELQRGYKLGDRLLRPARVKVSVQS